MAWEIAEYIQISLNFWMMIPFKNYGFVIKYPVGPSPVLLRILLVLLAIENIKSNNKTKQQKKPHKI